MQGSFSCLCSIVRPICLWVVRAGCVSALGKDVLFPADYLMRWFLHTVLGFPILAVYKLLNAVDVSPLPTSLFHDTTLFKAQQRHLLPSPQPTSASSHILVSILFWVAGGFGGQPSG